MVLIIAHRGFRVGVPENTLRAFSIAVASGVDFIELDAQRSADGEVFVLHDETLARTMNVAARLAELTAAQVDAINATRGDTGIPRLSDVVDRVIGGQAKPVKTRLMIELKGLGTGAAVASLALARHVEDAVAFSGKDLSELAAAHECAPGVPLCLNITSCKEFTTKQLATVTTREDLPLPFSMISLRARDVKLGFIHACHHLGVLALAWDFIRERRPVDLLRRLVHVGLDGALIDDPGMVESTRALRRQDR